VPVLTDLRRKDDFENSEKTISRISMIQICYPFIVTEPNILSGGDNVGKSVDTERR
jgi:hypothetical protein